MLAAVPLNEVKDGGAEPTRHEWFATTHWSVVLAAKQGDSSVTFSNRSMN